MCLFTHEVTPRAPTRQKTLGSRLGSLYYDNITILAILPRRRRHDQPNESYRRPCGRAAGWRPPLAYPSHHLQPCEVNEHGDVRLWGHQGAPLPERMPSQWCTGCGERRHRGGDKTPPCVPRSQELQSNRRLACGRGRNRQLHYHGGVLSSLDFVELVHLFFEFVQLSVKNLRRSEGGERARQ
jgi:hypothetical protein